MLAVFAVAMVGRLDGPMAATEAAPWAGVVVVGLHCGSQTDM